MGMLVIGGLERISQPIPCGDTIESPDRRPGHLYEARAIG